MSADTLSNLELIKPFCEIDEDYNLFALLEPYYFNGYAFATDGRILAGFPSLPFDNRVRRVPNGKHVLDTHKPRGEWQKMPEIPKCDVCEGKGEVKILACKRCDGSGEVAHNCDCDLCDESYEECSRCDGTGRHKDGTERTVVCGACSQKRINLLGNQFQLRYLQKIADLPNAEICEASQEYALVFRSGEIVGVLMGVAE